MTKLHQLIYQYNAQIKGFPGLKLYLNLFFEPMKLVRSLIDKKHITYSKLPDPGWVKDLALLPDMQVDI